MLNLEVAGRRCSIKKVFLNISQSSQENKRPCWSFFFNKVVGLRLLLWIQRYLVWSDEKCNSWYGYLYLVKVTCSVQIWKKTVKIVTSFVSFIKNDIMFMNLIYIYKKPIILSLFKSDTLKFTMYILANLKYPLKTYVRLHNQIWMSVFFTIKDHNFFL